MVKFFSEPEVVEARWTYAVNIPPELRIEAM